MAEEVLATLQKVGAFRSGHFVLTSGRHSDSYVNKDAMYAYTHDLSALCKRMADLYRDKKVDVVIGPAVGAAILAQWVAFHLTEMNGRSVYSVYADKDGNGGFVIKRGYDQLVKGKNTLIVEDLTTTGGSIKKVVDAVRVAGGTVVGAITICNRGDVTKEMVGNPAEFSELAKVHLESWDEDECDLCKRGIPVNTDVGHGKAFLENKISPDR
ncbi:orotate phosphoribosyltransferase [Candidatus Kaiserbacteria bacterium]|nr:orotate phosphoribosyltransferase [Candidatus Kaiserbacteria bacterium]